MPAQFPPGVAEQMAKSEGTVQFRYTLPKPLTKPPPERVILADTQQGRVLARLELDEHYNVTFLRADLDSGSREAVVNVEQLHGTQSFFIALVWSPNELRVHIGPHGGQGPLLQGQSI